MATPSIFHFFLMYSLVELDWCFWSMLLMEDSSSVKLYFLNRLLFASRMAGYNVDFILSSTLASFPVSETNWLKIPEMSKNSIILQV